MRFGRENSPSWCDVQSQAKKVIFLNGEVFFFLTRPLMGDPFILRGNSLEEIGREFKVAKYSSVSSVIERMKTKIAKNRKLKMHIDKLKEEINMSQEQT